TEDKASFGGRFPDRARPFRRCPRRSTPASAAIRRRPCNFVDEEKRRAAPCAQRFVLQQSTTRRGPRTRARQATTDWCRQQTSQQTPLLRLTPLFPDRLRQAQAQRAG